MKTRSVIIGAGLLLGAVACMNEGGSVTSPGRQVPRQAARTEIASSPTLLSCPSTGTQTTTGVVGLLGGVVSLGAARIEVPFGAVLDPTLFEIVVPASPYMEVEIHAVGLSSFLFRRPVQVTIDYSRCGDSAIPDGAQLQGVYIDGVTKSVLQEMGGTDDRAARRITFSTGHLSGYAVAY
jgi:hypothetical protein